MEGNKHIGSLLQIAAKGPQDQYIHIENDSHIFRDSYKQHTNFAIENLEKEFKDATLNSTIQFEIDNKGDLLKDIVLQVQFPTLSGTNVYSSTAAINLINKVKITIDNLVLSNYDGLFIYIFNKMYNKKYNDFKSLLKLGKKSKNLNCVYIPLLLWNMTDVQSFIPISSLKTSKVKVYIELAKLDDLYISPQASKYFVKPQLKLRKGKIKLNLNVMCNKVNEVSNFNIKAFINYILLNDNEKQMFLNNEGQHLFSQILVQTEKLSNNINKIYLNFNIPIKQLIWVILKNDTISDEFTFESFTKGKLILDKNQNTDGMKYYSSDYFKLIQSYYYNECYHNENIYSYSFSLKPFINNPTGCVDFSLLNTKILEIHGDNLKGKYIRIYASGLNVLLTNNGSSHLKVQLT